MNNDTSLVKVSGILIFLWGKMFNYPYTTKGFDAQPKALNYLEDHPC